MSELYNKEMLVGTFLDLSAVDVSALSLKARPDPVSYTHLTLPTILLV